LNERVDARCEDGVAEAATDELQDVVEDWDAVVRFLPQDWQDKASELGAVQRRLRGFDGVESLLRVLLIHLADGCSLRETAVRAHAGGLAAVSDVALLKRLRACGPWFRWMTQQLNAKMGVPLGDEALLPGRRVRLVDGTTVSEPGATGSTWRLHYALNLQTLACEEVHVSGANEGESLTRFDVSAGDVIMADRGFARQRGLRHVVQHGGDVLLRTSLSNLPLQDHDGERLDVLALLRTLKVGEAGDWSAHARDSKGSIAVRVCAYRKTAAQTRQALHDIDREAVKKRTNVRPETREAAGYVIVLTTLLEPEAADIMEFYRRRWQIELAFKRLKTLLQLGHLKKFDEDGAKAWLQGKVLVASMIETLIFTAERFSPWGYDQHATTAPMLVA
jgi:DDE family transposase